MKDSQACENRALAEASNLMYICIHGIQFISMNLAKTPSLQKLPVLYVVSLTTYQKKKRGTIWPTADVQLGLDGCEGQD